MTIVRESDGSVSVKSRWKPSTIRIGFRDFTWVWLSEIMLILDQRAGSRFDYNCRHSERG